MRFAFTIPGTPVGWHTGTPVRRGGKTIVVTPPVQRAYRDRVRLIALAARPAHWPTRAKSYRLDMAIMQRRAKPDRTNVLKITEDALRGIAWVDDCRVDRGEPIRIRDLGIVECVEVAVEA